MKCPYCISDETFTYYHANMPNILAACPEKMHESLKVFPIEAQLCKACGLGFNATRLEENELKFIYDNYCYISPLHAIGYSKYSGMIETLKKYCSKSDKLVEIGCSEGYLLHLLKNEGYFDLTGIEPGPQADDAKSLGLRIIKDYFTTATSFDREIDTFFLMHVYEHLDDPFSMLDNILSKLSKTGKIIIEIPDFGGYCHQHLFYFNVHFLMRLARDKNLKIVELIEENDSLRVIFVHRNNPAYSEVTKEESIADVIGRANRIQSEFQNKINVINDLVKEHRGKKIYWWGAGSASTIFINQLDRDMLLKRDLVIIDGDLNKIGYCIPGFDIRVQHFDILKHQTLDILIIASSFSDEIKKAMEKDDIHAKRIEIIY